MTWAKFSVFSTELVWQGVEYHTIVIILVNLRRVCPGGMFMCAQPVNLSYELSFLIVFSLPALNTTRQHSAHTASHLHTKWDFSLSSLIVALRKDEIGVGKTEQYYTFSVLIISTMLRQEANVMKFSVEFSTYTSQWMRNESSFPAQRVSASVSLVVHWRHSRKAEISTANNN